MSTKEKEEKNIKRENIVKDTNEESRQEIQPIVIEEVKSVESRYNVVINNIMFTCTFLIDKVLRIGEHKGSYLLIIKIENM